MSGVLFTGLGTLSPKVYNIFLLLMAVGFFGVYVPWNEKKKKGGQMSIGSAAPRQEKPHTPMSRARALAAVIGCIPVMTVGLTMLIACAIMGQPLWMAIGAVLTIFSLVRMLRAGEDFRAGRQSKPAPQKPKTAPSFRPDSPDHEHITPAGPDTQHQLEQLDRLLEAGLLTPKEYEAKRQEITKDL